MRHTHLLPTLTRACVAVCWLQVDEGEDLIDDAGDVKHGGGGGYESKTFSASSSSSHQLSAQLSQSQSASALKPLTARPASSRLRVPLSSVRFHASDHESGTDSDAEHGSDADGYAFAGAHEQPAAGWENDDAGELNSALASAGLDGGGGGGAPSISTSTSSNSSGSLSAQASASAPASNAPSPSSSAAAAAAAPAAVAAAPASVKPLVPISLRDDVI